MQITTALVGLLVGIVVGMTSTGGGALLTPALLMLGIPPTVAIGSDVLAASGMKLFGGGIYALKREVHWGTVARLAAGSVPGAITGVLLLNRLGGGANDVLRHGVGVMLLIAALASLARLALAGRIHPTTMPGTGIVVALGAATGFLVAVTSVGSGSLLLCVLTLFFPLKPRTLVGTDLVHALILTTVATAGHWLSGRVDVALAAAILAGGAPGVFIGARLASVMPERVLRAGLAVTLLVIGVQLQITPRPTVATASGDLPSATRVATHATSLIPSGEAPVAVAGVGSREVSR